MSAFVLPHRVGIILPKNSNDGIPFGDSIVENVEIALSKQFGGATSHDANGSWISDDGKLIREPVTIVYSHVSEYEISNNGAIPFIENLAVELKDELHQHVIAYLIDNALYLYS